MFRTVHCLRCDEGDVLRGSFSTADNAWKRSKKPVGLGLMASHVSFLDARVANVERIPTKQDGPIQREILGAAKAARCAIDWAIKQEATGLSVGTIFGGDLAPWRNSL